MIWVRRSLAAKVVVGGLTLLVIVISTVSATFLINRDRQANAAATGMADNRAVNAARLLGQTVGTESANALALIAKDHALTDIMSSEPPLTSRAALDIDAGAASASTAVVIVDLAGRVVYGREPAAWEVPPANYVTSASLRTSLDGGQVHGVDVVAGEPVYAVSMPLLRGGQVVGAIGAFTPIRSQLQRFAAITGYPVVLVAAADRTHMVRADVAGTVVSQTTPAELLASLLEAGTVSRVTDRSGRSGHDRAISVVPVVGLTGTQPVVFLGVEVPLHQFTGDARSQAEDVATVAMIAVFAILVTTLALVWFVNVVVRRPLARLERAVARITAGDYSANIPITSSDELGRLAENVNGLRKKVAATVQVMELQANTDAHTGLFNFRFLMDHLHQESASAIRYGTSISVLMIDIDHFKRVNDTYGHPGGDCALASIATRIAKSIRQADIAARYGGEEFALIMPFTDHAHALLVAEKIRAAVAKTPIRLGQRHRATITISIGVASYPEDCATPDLLLQLADAALYQAKNGGRNRVAGAPAHVAVAEAGPRTEAGLVGVPHGRRVRGTDRRDRVLP